MEIRDVQPKKVVSRFEEKSEVSEEKDAPYKSSSLASRFWGSPLKFEGKTGQEEEK